MTCKAELNAITLTANAKTVVSAKGHDIAAVNALVGRHIDELKVVLNQLISLHPTGGGDAANLTALQAILTELT